MKLEKICELTRKQQRQKKQNRNRGQSYVILPGHGK